MNINTIEDLNKPEIKNFIELFTGNNSILSLKIAFILEEKTSKIVGIFDIQSISFPDETNSKRFSIKGRDLEPFLQKYLNISNSNLNNIRGIQDDLDNLQTKFIEYSENMFGCICYGKFGY